MFERYKLFSLVSPTDKHIMSVNPSAKAKAMARIPRKSILVKDAAKHSKYLPASISLCKRVYLTSNKHQYMITQQEDTLYVCFKGCSKFSDYITSIDIRSCKIQGTTVGLHNGYCEKSKFYQQPVQDAILHACESGHIRNIVYTGHSAGGSMAEMTAVFVDGIIRDDRIKRWSYTFGSPKAGDLMFKEALENVCDGQVLRVEMYNDIVCLLPIQSSFQHAGNLVMLKDNHVIDVSNFDVPEPLKYYYQDYGTFLHKLNSAGLLTKGSIVKMVRDHSIETYIENASSILVEDW